MFDKRASISLVSESTACAFAVDDENRILAWSRVATAILGRSADQVVGRSASEVVEAKDLFGNRWCSRHYGLHEMARRGEPIQSLWLMVKKQSGLFGQFFGTVTAVPVGERTDEGGGEFDLVFEFHEERRRQTAGALVERLLYRQIGYPTPRSSALSDVPQLTQRQKEVLSLLAEGLEPPKIAKRLGVSLNTVRNHIQRILFNLNCHTQANAVAIAIRQGLI